MNPRTLITIAICLSTFGLANAAIFDLEDDFSATTNPNGAWQYGYAGSGYPAQVGQPFTIYDTPTTRGSAFDFWVRGGQNQDPNVFHNDAATPASSFGYTLQPNQAAFNHAEYSSIYRWVAPTAGDYAVEADFVALDAGSPHVYVMYNGAVLFDANLASQGMTAQFATVQFVSAGGYFEFVLGQNDSVNPSGLAVTGVDATITNVPEPSSVALLAVGSMLAVLRRIKRSA